MTWTKLSDGFIGDPELIALPRGVRLFHVEALVWSNAQGTDGRIPSHMLTRFSDEPDPAGAAEALVTAGKWTADAGGWQIVDFAADQISAAEMARRREESALRTKRWDHHRRGEHDLCRPGWCKQADASSNASADAAGDALPSRPTRPARNGEGKGGRSSRARPTAARSRSGRSRRGTAPEEQREELRVRLGTYTWANNQDEWCTVCGLSITKGQTFRVTTVGKLVHDAHLSNGLPDTGNAS